MNTARKTAGSGRADGKRRARAFTLVELLVAVALVGVLFSLLGPVLVQAKNKARELQCLNNTRNLGIAHSLYSADHGDHLLPHAVFRPEAVQGPRYFLYRGHFREHIQAAASLGDFHRVAIHNGGGRARRRQWRGLDHIFFARHL